MGKAPDPQRLALRCVELGVVVRQALAGQLLPYGITPEQHEVLALIAGGVTSARQLSEAIGRDKTTVSRVLARAKVAGLLVEEQSPTDRRRNVLCLTEKGAATVDQTRRLLDRAAPRLLEPLTPKDRRRLDKIMGKLKTHLCG